MLHFDWLFDFVHFTMKSKKVLKTEPFLTRTGYRYIQFIPVPYD
jgi:hypothetical protein